MRILLITMLTLLMGFHSSAQDLYHFFVAKNEMGITQSVLQDAVTLSDLHERYKADWIATYISTEITVTADGTSVSAKGQDATLSKAQKEVLAQAAVGSDINLRIKYIPQNDLLQNAEKEMEYDFTVAPFHSAKCAEEETFLNKYIDVNILAHLSKEQKNTLVAGKIEFTVSEEGEIEDVIIQESAGTPEIDEIIKKGICNMDDWTPAENSQGTKIKQNIKFYIANKMKSCAVNLILE